MDWSQGYSAKYYLSILDKETMRDVDRIELTGGTIKRSLTDLRESADIDCINYTNKEEQYIRVWLDTRQNSESSHIPLFTGLAICPTNKFKGRLRKNAIQCYSILKVAQDIHLDPGWYAPAEVNGGRMIKELLSVIKTKLIIADNPPNLSQAIIAEFNENRLSMTDKILDAMNWAMRLDGYGNIYIGPINHEDVASFDSNENDIIETELDVTYDWYSAPNVFRAFLDSDYAVARDDDPRSPLSTVSRGREVWLEEKDVQLNENETLAEYSRRMLKEHQRASTSISYSRRYYPNVYPGDAVRINYPAQLIQGHFLVTDQNISLGYNANTSEEVVML